jgi:hypothetical protein
MLFDLGPRLLTTRDVARMVKAGGAEALTEAERRADAARYQEIQCRSALNPVKGMPFSWTLNPYRGCTHACHYCFARRYQTQLELGAGDEFSSLIFVKTNFVDVLRRELDHPKWMRELAALGRRPIRISRSKGSTRSRAARCRRSRPADRPSASSPRGR